MSMGVLLVTTDEAKVCRSAGLSGDIHIMKSIWQIKHGIIGIFICENEGGEGRNKN